MKDVVIGTTETQLEHKYAENVPDGHECYWTVSGTPRQTAPGRRVWFTFRPTERVFATAEITRLEDGKLWFTPVRRVETRKCLRTAPRGFKYTEPPEFADRL